MFKNFYPSEMTDSAYDIDYKMFYDNGIRGVLFDIDNTLVPHGAPATDEAIGLFKKIHDIGLDTCLISNNKEPRVKPFADLVSSKYICKANKPSVKKYKEAMRLMNTDENSTLFVGDQLFTDVYGANRSGIYSVLTKPINPKEEIQIVLKRRLEWVVLRFYKMYTKNKNK